MPDRTPLPETMGYLLAQVCKLHRQLADDLLNEIGLHVGQEMVLCALWEKEGVTQTELGEHLAVQPATVTNALRRLERKGLVERMSDADDQRISRGFPTTEGRQRRADVEEKWNQLEQVSFAGITAREQDLLRGLLASIQTNLADQQARRTLSATGLAQQGMTRRNNGQQSRS